MKNQQFKRSKNIWKNENEAFADVQEKQSIEASQLQPAHTEKHFVWNVVIATGKENYIIAISEVQDKAAAKQQAMNYFNTFEGNLKGNHTETHYRFSKVR